jgi:hypothetical protein
MLLKKKRKKPRNLKKQVANHFTNLGWTVGDCESRRGPITVDLFGVADLIIFAGSEVRLIQVTSKENKASRRKKCEKWLKESGWLYGVRGNGGSRTFSLALVDKDGIISTELLS